MPDPLTLDLDPITRKRAALAKLDAKQADLALDLAGARARADRLRSTGATSAQITKADEALDRLVTAAAANRTNRFDVLADIDTISNAFVEAARPELGVTALDATIPVAMLPVRIETRFGTDAKTLDVRIYPDQAHLDSHEPGLTADERAAGEWYWTHRWPDLASVELAGVAWQKLVERFRPGRARYLVELLRPGNESASPGSPPRFPETPVRASSWTRSLEATALPDRWAAVGFQGDTEVFRVWSTRVPDRLAAGPSPSADDVPTVGPDPDQPLVQDAFRWAVDLQAARDAGMALTVRDSDLVRGRKLRDGLTRLVVAGVDWTLTPEQGSDTIGALLAGHTATGDLGFVAPGTPTNNTAAAPSGFSTARAERAAAWAPPPVGVEPDARPDTAAGRLAAALGIDPVPLAIAPGADGHQHRTASALVDALWEGTGGYYATELLDPLVPDRLAADLRAHAAAHLHPSGPLPALRIGPQPYGVLPVVARRYQPTRGDRAEAAIARVGSAMRSLWNPLVDLVPQLGRAGEKRDADEIMLDLLQRTPVPWTTRWREMIPPPQWASTDWMLERRTYQAPVLYTVMDLLGVPSRNAARVQYLMAADDSTLLNVPLVLKGDEGTAYLGELAGLARGGSDGRRALNLRQNSIALLESLLAFAAVQEMDKGASGYLVEGLAEADLVLKGFTHLGVRTPDLVRVETPDPDRKPLAFQSARELAVLTAPQTGILVHDQLSAELISTGLDDLIGKPTAPAHATARFLKAVDTLVGAPAAEIEWAFRGVLDLYSSRLDAWFTSLATSRLARQRADRPVGVHIGCYGWVDDLVPDTGAAAESLGYVGAPSLAHAVAAALLRSGRQAHAAEDAFALDLSSRRVREAMSMLEGVAAGQSIAALVGYRIERRLHDAGLADLTVPLRVEAPLQSRQGDLDTPVESVAARDVVDGVRLLSLFAGPAAAWSALLDRAGVSAARRPKLAGVLTDVAQNYDAVTDVLFAETIYQTAAGNLDRASAAASALDRQQRPVEPEVIRTPRDGAVVASRVVVALDSTARAAGWTARGVRGSVEPRLDRWLGGLLGDPAALAIVATPVAAAGPQPPAVTVTAADLGLSPLALALAAQRPSTGGRSELEHRVWNIAADRIGSLTAADRIEITAPSLLLTVAGWAGRLASGTRALAPGDLTAGDGAPTGSADLADLDNRVATAEAALRSARADLSPAPTTATALRTRLEAVAELVGGDALPDVVPGSADEADHLRLQFDAVALLLDERIAAFERRTAEPVDPSADPTARASELIGIALGGPQPVLPLITLAAPEELAASLADEDALLAGDATAPLSWLHRMSLVRPDLDPLAGLLTHCEASGTDVVGSLVVGQLPHRPGARWCELPFGAEGAAPAGTVGIAVIAPDGFDPTKPTAGLFVDAWTEVVPSARHSAGVSFHYDAPGARPPQAIVLAVHPEPNPDRWDFETLLATIDETRSLARLRTLSLKEIEGFAGLIPALYLPNNYTRDVPSVPLRWLIEAADKAKLSFPLSDIVGK